MGLTKEIIAQSTMTNSPDRCSAGSADDPLCKRIGVGDCEACGAAPNEKCIKNGPTEKYPNRRYCKDDQSCCDFCCGN